MSTHVVCLYVDLFEKQRRERKKCRRVAGKNDFILHFSRSLQVHTGELRFVTICGQIK